MIVRNMSDDTTVDLGQAPLTEDETRRLKQVLFNAESQDRPPLHEVSATLMGTLNDIMEERRLITIGRDFYRQLQKLPGIQTTLRSDPLVDQWHIMTQSQRLEYGRMADQMGGR